MSRLTACPFEKERRYRVLQDVLFLNHHLEKGAEVVFKDCAYDFKLGVTGYWFNNVENGETNAWRAFDSARQEIEHWQTYFMEIKGQKTESA